MASPTNASRVPRWKATAPVVAAASTSASDFHQLLSFDLSPLEKRFDEVFARLDALEQALSVPSARGNHEDGALHDEKKGSSGSPRADGSSGDSKRSDDNTGMQATGLPMDKSDLAKELEDLHATQLRLKIQHELAQASYKVDMEALRRDLIALPQHADLHNFRAEMDVLLTTTMKTLGDQQMLLWQDVERSLAGRDLAENQWKAQFENSMNTRIQDVWAGIQASQQKVDETLSSLQVDMCKVEAAMRETVDNVDLMKLKLKELEKRTTRQEEEGINRDNDIAQLHALQRQANIDMATQDAVLQSAIDLLKNEVDRAENRHTQEQETYKSFVADVERTLSFCAHEIQTTIHATLQVHQDKLMALDGGLTTLSAELKTCQDHLQKTDSRLGSLDGRLVQQEKHGATLAHIIQEQQHEMSRHVNEIHKSMELAMQDRVAIKRAATETSFTVQEIQQTLQEVSKMASTTELSLTRTAAEIPKLHVLATTNTANIAKNRQTLADLTQSLVDEKTFSHQLKHNFDKEVQSSVARFADLHQRDEATQQSIGTTNTTMHNIKHALEESIKYNSNMIHQLNSMVDSLAITESPTDMDDKLARFSLETAELGLKLEHFVASTPGGGHGTGTLESGVVLVRDDVKAELAVLLTKIIRFLGSGVSIDQNKYFLSAAKLALPSHDPASGALIFELPASNILEQIRSAKVTLFVTKMRAFMDQLRPVAHSVRHIHEFRDSFERKIRYVLEFGLSNLFPNLGRPRNPNRRNPNAGTCIACDRPLEEEEDEDATRGFMRIVETLDPEVEAVEDQKLRKSKLLASASSGPVASAGITHKIDTRTSIRGRSGGLPPSSATQQRPRSAMAGINTSNGIPSGSVFHQAPGTNEYIYRAGFRLPRPSTAGASKTANADELAALHGLVMAVGGSSTTQQIDHTILAQTLDDTMSSCLEKVALVGKNNNQNSSVATVEVPKPAFVPPTPVVKSPSLAPTVRPHTAPLRSRSLPRLEVFIESASTQ